MTSVPGGSCKLNPDAPLFIPAAFRQVEDFSPEWWELIKTSTWFREYWADQHQQEESYEAFIEDDTDLGIDDLEAQLEELAQYSKSDEANASADLTLPADKTQSADPDMDVETLLRNQSLSNASKEKGSKSPLASPKYVEKPVKCVSPKYSPRRIHQPR